MIDNKETFNSVLNLFDFLAYSCLPYGNGPYHLVATLSTISNPAVCFLLFVIPKPTKRSVTVVFILAMLVASYLMTTAVESPSPPLVNKLEGEILLVSLTLKCGL